MVGFNKYATLALMWAATTAAVSQGQNPLFFQPERSDDVFLLAPRPLMRLLREGEIAFQEQRYADGITALSSLLLAGDESDDQKLPADVRGQDYFIDQDANGLFHQSLKGKALQLLSQLPPEGRRTLEVQLGVTARRELSAAIAAKDFEQLSEVARRYLHTEAGYDAQVLWAQYKLTSGYPLAAASLLQSLLDYPAARERYGPGLALAAARAWRLAGNPEAAGLVMRMAAGHFPGQSVDVAGQQIELDPATDWVALLGREVSPDQLPVVSRDASSWLVGGGAEERNATSAASMPLPTERWVREIHSSLPEQQAIERQAEAETQKGRVLLPKFELRMVDDLVLTKTTDASLLAIDFDSGVIKWPLYFHNAPVPLTNLPYAVANGQAALSSELQNRVWGSSAFGKFSCDQQRLYLVSEQNDQLLNAESMFRSNERSADSNFLEAASIAAEGAIVWRVGGVDGVDEPQLADAYFLGPPLPYEGDLYCLADFKGETKLVVLNATSGRLRWQQQLVHSAGSPLRIDAERRSQALSPTISDGVILCPTGLGAVAAVDLLTRGLKWGATYTKSRSQPNLHGRGRMFGEGPEFSPLERRWQEPAMIAQDGVLLISPPESEDFQCRDILTGQLRLVPQRRNSYRYLAGMKNGRLVVVGERHVAAIELSSGKAVWQTEFPSGLTLAGKGLWQLDSLMLPLSDRQLIRINTSDGAISEQMQVSQPLGNLFAYKQQLLSVSSSAVTVYYTRDALAEQVATRLAENPDDVWALNQQSQLALVNGDLMAAFESLEKSYKLDSDSADTRYLLVNLLLDGLQQDFAAFEGSAQKYADVVEFGPQRFRFLQQFTLGKIRSGQHLAAFERLLMLIPQSGSTFAATQNRQRETELSNGHVVDSDAWIATELARAYAQASAADRLQMDALVAAELATIENMLIPLQREKLRYLHWLPGAESALISLASSMLGGDEQTIAEQLLLPLLHSDNPQSVQAAEKLLAQPTLADRYASSFGRLDFQPTTGRSPVTPPAEVGMPQVEWPAGMVQVEVNDNSRYAYGVPVEVISERYGRPELSVALSGSMVMLRTAHGVDRARLEFPGATAEAATDEMTRATIRGGLLLIEKSSEIAAFDMQRDLMTGSDALLWRHSLFSPGAAPHVQFARQEVDSQYTQLGFAISRRKMPLRQQSIVGPLTPAGVVVQVGTNLLMLDALSGRQIWKRDGYDDTVSLAAKGLELAVVSRSGQQVEILDCRDGAPIRQFDISGKWTHWFSHNGLMVELSRSDAIPAPPPTLRIWDAFTGEERLQMKTAAGSSADVCEGRYLVVLEPSSQIHYCDLGAASAPLVTHHPVTTSPTQVNSIQVERFEDRLAVLCSTEKGAPGLEELTVVNGDVFGLQIETGALLWDKPGRLMGMQFPKAQPRQSPFMIVFRTFPERDNVYPASVALIDLRSGRLAYSNSNLGLHASSGFDMDLHPENHMIEVGLGARSLRFSMTAEPHPPQPTFFFGTPHQESQSSIDRELLNNPLFGR